MFKKATYISAFKYAKKVLNKVIKIIPFKKGSEVVIIKNLGKNNEDDLGNEEDYYFDDAGNIADIPLDSKGTVKKVEGNKVFVKLEDNGHEYPFHKKELKITGQVPSPLGKFPSYIFDLASQMPLFLINDRMYVLDGADNPKSDFFQTNIDKRIVRSRLVESAKLSRLEELAQAHNAKEYDKIERGYLQEVIEERNQNVSEKSADYKLVDFIVNEIFPHFRGNIQDSTKLGNLLGIKSSGKRTESKPLKSEKHEEDPFISKIIEGIEKESYQLGDKKNTRKLDTLLGYDPHWDIAEFPQDYKPYSLLGSILEGRNVAVIDNVFYNLVWTNDLSHKRTLNVSGKNFALVSPKQLEEVKARYVFELSKQARINALRNKLTQDSRLKELAQRNGNLGSLVKKKEYSEGEFGFIKGKRGYDFDDMPSYWVFLQVPKHALKMPDEENVDDYDDYDDERERKPKDRYYLFNKVRVAVNVFINENDEISYNEDPVTVEAYDHPFTTQVQKFGKICLGAYDNYKLNKLKKGEAVARLLADTRKTLLSGYIKGENPARQLDDFTRKRITLSQARKNKIPITNINIERRRRRR